MMVLETTYDFLMVFPRKHNKKEEEYEKITDMDLSTLLYYH